MNKDNINFIKSLDKDELAKIKEKSPFSFELYKELKMDSDGFEDESIFEDEFVMESLESLVETINNLGINPKPKKVEQVKPQAKAKPSKGKQSKQSKAKEEPSPQKKKITAQELKEKEKESKLRSIVEGLEKKLREVKGIVEENSKYKENIATEISKHMASVPFGPGILGSKNEPTVNDFESVIKFLEYRIKNLKGKIKFYTGVMKQDNRDFKRIAKNVGFTYTIAKVESKKVRTIGAKKEKSLLEKAQRGFKKWWNS